jgi:FKBP-type peptidyl-prolyl cis-trans isomerase
VAKDLIFDYFNPAEVENAAFKVEVTKKGHGPNVRSGQKVTIHYTGKLLNGVVFDSSLTRGTPFTCTIGVGQVIKGWDRGVV